VRIWDVASGEELSTVFGYTAEVEDVAFSPDGTHLTTLSRDGVVRTYSLEIEALMAFACERLTRNLSPDEWEAFVGPAVDYHETCPGLPVPP
jgi:WD40 repeat protein